MRRRTGDYRRRSKFGAVRTVVDGITFASKAEARRYQELKLLERAKKIHKLELQPKFDLDVNGQKICRYIADFAWWEGPVPNDGRNPRIWTQRVVADAKGFKTPVYRLKKKLMKAIYGIDIREL